MTPEHFEKGPERGERPLKDRIVGLRNQAYEHLGHLEAYSRISEFIHRLYQGRPDCTNYKVYHWLKKSTPREDDKEGDFEGEYSVEAFLKSLLEERENPSS